MRYLIYFLLSNICLLIHANDCDTLQNKDFDNSHLFPALRKEILEFNEELIQAYENEDVEKLKNMLTEDHIHNNIFGSPLTKAELLKDIQCKILLFDYYRNPEIKMHFYDNGNLCISTGIIEAGVQRLNKKIEGKFRYTRVFQKINGQWHEQLFSNTKIP